MAFHDSGQRQQFDGGGQRDTAEGKPRYDLISPTFADLLYHPGLAAAAEALQSLLDEEASTADALLVKSVECWRFDPLSEQAARQALAALFVTQFRRDPVDAIARTLKDHLQQALVAGAKKYDERNWEQGIPTSRSFASLCRHTQNLIDGSRDEDHIGAFLCNTMFIWHNQTLVSMGLMDEKWADWAGYAASPPTQTSFPPDDTEMSGEDKLSVLQEADEEIANRETEKNEAVALWFTADRDVPADVAGELAGGYTPALLVEEPKGLTYIAGPMRGYPEYNFPAFDAARDAVTYFGFDAISPADVDRSDGFDESEGDGETCTQEQIRRFVRRDFYSIFALRPEEGDRLILHSKWEASTGAVAEFFLARWLNVPPYLLDLEADPGDHTIRPLHYEDIDWKALESTVGRWLAKVHGPDSGDVYNDPGVDYATD